METYRLFIDGKYCDSASGATFEVTCPCTNEKLGIVAQGSRADVDRAVQSAATAFQSSPWRLMKVEDRIQLLRKVGELIRKRQNELARLEALDTGNPIRFVQSLYLPGAAGCFDFYPPLTYHLTGEQIPVSSEHLIYTVHEPIGVVAIIIPWNDPLEIASSRLAAALTVGNTCVLKPSPVAPLTCLCLGEILQEAGIPPGVVNIVAGEDSDVGNSLINHPLVRMVTFTGSLRTARIVQRAAAKTTKRVSLEMGGKSPNIVLPDADLPAAVVGAAQAIYLMSGQNCIAGSRLLLHESIHDEFVGRLVEETRRYRLGHVLDPKTTIGPLISPNHLAKVKDYVVSGRTEGAELVFGGDSPAETELRNGNYFMPTIFTGVQPWMRIAREEIFGPVLCILKFSTVQEAVALANNSQYGLGAGIWTRNLNAAHHLATLIEAGTIYVNTYNEFYYQVPFAGLKESGLGHEYGLDVLRHYTQRKTVLVRLEPGPCEPLQS